MPNNVDNVSVLKTLFLDTVAGNSDAVIHSSFSQNSLYDEIEKAALHW